ncbi:hypothetical protein BDW02DRAFT_321568 [Decorospora gaudefroyi]|uniref:Uncharacterized protein n=1 Tax=Decorospora gaudefroyi TaxID=184978 RepID=A0A6A5KES4_9PLEO|nr:hypothetical protein BDW02DRAFT_321568 [Decorospora gaudefroyi]
MAAKVVLYMVHGGCVGRLLRRFLRRRVHDKTFTRSSSTVLMVKHISVTCTHTLRYSSPYRLSALSHLRSSCLRIDPSFTTPLSYPSSLPSPSPLIIIPHHHAHTSTSISTNPNTNTRDPIPQTKNMPETYGNYIQDGGRRGAVSGQGGQGQSGSK